jgi:hypothetical protein
MGLFEQYPILLVVVIIGVIEGWSGLKSLLKRLYRHRLTSGRRDEAGVVGR